MQNFLGGLSAHPEPPAETSFACMQSGWEKISLTFSVGDFISFFLFSRVNPEQDKTCEGSLGTVALQQACIMQLTLPYVISNKNGRNMASYMVKVLSQKVSLNQNEWPPT